MGFGASEVSFHAFGVSVCSHAHLACCSQGRLVALALPTRVWRTDASFVQCSSPLPLRSLTPVLVHVRCEKCECTDTRRPALVNVQWLCSCARAFSISCLPNREQLPIAIRAK